MRSHNTKGVDMEYSILFDLVLFFSMEVLLRICVREAIHYKRNKRQFRDYVNKIKRITHYFRLYSPGDSNAPKNMAYFQLLRIINVICFCANCVLMLVGKKTICGYLLCARIALFYLPYFLYVTYALLKGPGRKKDIDFSIFKKP